VTASMRRIPAATPPSDTILNKPMSPVRTTGQIVPDIATLVSKLRNEAKVI